VKFNCSRTEVVFASNGKWNKEFGTKQRSSLSFIAPWWQNSIFQTPQLRSSALIYVPILSFDYYGSWKNAISSTSRVAESDFLSTWICPCKDQVELLHLRSCLVPSWCEARRTISDCWKPSSISSPSEAAAPVLPRLKSGMKMNVLPTQGRRQRRASGARPPHFTFGPPVAAYIQYCILKMWPPSRFCPPLLLHPGDGPVFTTAQIVFCITPQW